MNWLAHLLLSEPTPDAQLGGILADVMRGNSWQGMTEGFWSGVARHRRIDAFTDSHPLFMTSRERLGASGLLRGVVVDLVYDHMLTRHWHTFVDEDLRPFLDRFYRTASSRLPAYPEEAKRFVRAMVEIDLLSSYGTQDGLARALARIDARLRSTNKKRATASSYLPAVAEQYQRLEQDFLRFFPDAIAFIADGP